MARFDDATWTTYMPGGSVHAVAIDDNGVKWFGTNGGVTRFDGITWTNYDIPGGVVVIAIDNERNKWFGHWGVHVLYGGQDCPITENAQWLDGTHWRATYDVTSLIPRSDYTISVSGARGTDGMEISTDTRFGFTVDYVGEITDQTPSPPPSVIAGGVEGDASTVKAMWWASDPDSSITGYRYTIGSAPGATDIVNWTFISATGATGLVGAASSGSITRSGLGLVEGRQYWLAVQARNVGGLWSASGYCAFVAGRPIQMVFLPVVLRNQ